MLRLQLPAVKALVGQAAITWFAVGAATALIGSGAYAQQQELKLGHVGTVQSSYHLGAKKFAEVVKSETDGGIQVKIFPNAQLGDERDLVEGLQLGTVQMAVAANSPLSGFVEEVLLFDLPFLFTNNKHWERVVDGRLGEEIISLFPSKGFRSLAYFDGGWRSPYNAKRPIDEREDIQGLKFRTMESPMHQAIYEALGAQAVAMPSSEQYSALQQGVVDGSDAPIEWYEQLKHYEIAKDLSELPLFKLTVHLLISEKTYQSLSAEQQRIVQKAGEKAEALQRREARKLRQQKLETLKEKHNVKVTDLKPGELQKFVDAMKDTVWKEYEDRVGRERIERILDAKK